LFRFRFFQPFLIIVINLLLTDFGIRGVSVFDNRYQFRMQKYQKGAFCFIFGN